MRSALQVTNRSLQPLHICYTMPPPARGPAEQQQEQQWLLHPDRPAQVRHWTPCHCVLHAAVLTGMRVRCNGTATRGPVAWITQAASCQVTMGMLAVQCPSAPDM